MSKYERNYRQIKAKFPGTCSVCDEQIFQNEKIWWHKFAKNTVHYFCLIQPLKKFKTKYSGKCKDCKKIISKGDDSYYDTSDSKLCCIQCSDIIQSKFLAEKYFHYDSFEQIISKLSKKLKKKIILEFDRNSENNFCKQDDDGFLVVLNGDIPMDSAFFHELGHVLYTGSSLSTLLLFRIEFDSLLEKKLGRKLTHDELIEISEVVHLTYNIMEDIRIESLLGQESSIIKEMFNDLCVISGKKWTSENEPDSPHGYLLARRFFREELIPTSFKKEISELYEFCLDTTHEKLLQKLTDWFLIGSMRKYIFEQLEINP